MKLPFHGKAKASIFKNARLLKKVMTPAEKLLWEKLRGRRFKDFKFRRQHPVSYYIVDFYCHLSRLVIEVNGEIHQLNDNASYDKNRTEILESLGLNVIRVTNRDVFENIDEVLVEIERNLIHRPSPTRRRE